MSRVLRRVRSIPWLLSAMFVLTFTSRKLLVLDSDLEGWTPSSSRNLSEYIDPDRNTTLIVPRLLTRSQGPFTGLVLVHSSPHNVERRRDIRETWMDVEQVRRHEILVLFYVGVTLDSGGLTNDLIRREAERHGDILQEQFIEHYNNLTIKSVMMLKFLVNLKQKIDFSFAMKVDDDVYLNLAHLPKSFSQPELTSSHALYGRRQRRSRPFRYAAAFSPNSKWICPTWMYEEEFFPPYLFGSGYVMPSGTLDCLYRRSLSTPLVHIEDVFVTGLVAEQCGFDRVNKSQFLGELADPCSQGLDFLHVHYINRQQLWDIKRSLDTGLNHC